MKNILVFTGYIILGTMFLGIPLTQGNLALSAIGWCAGMWIYDHLIRGK